VSAFVKEADNLRFQLERVLAHAQILGDGMDAPVHLRRDLTGVEYESMQRFLKRYDEAREAVAQSVAKSVYVEIHCERCVDR
jgi:polyhydroxyalkanoate synthesis regulator protein